MKSLPTCLNQAHKRLAANSRVQEYVIEPEQLFVIGKEAYLYCPNGYGKSKLPNTFLEKKLGVGATTRNWASVLKLYELSL